MERNISGRPAPDQRTGGDLHLRKRSPKIRLQTMIPEDLYERIRATAEQNEASISEVAYAILDRYYNGD